MSDLFSETVDKIAQIGLAHYRDQLLQRVTENRGEIVQSLNDLKPSKTSDHAVVISAGPSVHRTGAIRRIRESGYDGHVVAVDGAYVACLREGLVPDYVITLDPHPTRIVTWFGDPDIEKNSRGDDYFERQDLNVSFQSDRFVKNREHIELVDRWGCRSKALVATTAPANVVRRLKEARFDLYWWNPLVDNPQSPDSLTRRLYEIARVPCLNTGGTVGNAAWLFAATRLQCKTVGLVGMDFGYFHDTPIEKTQTYRELVEMNGGVTGIERFFTSFVFPQSGERYYTDPTYYWYRRNFMDLHKAVGKKVLTLNCSEGGTLFSDDIPCLRLADFLRRFGKG